MIHTLYWLDVECDRTGCEIFVNGIPAERLNRSHGIRMPVNEYLRAGSNRVEIRRGLWGSNKSDAEEGTITASIIAAHFEGIEPTGQEMLFRQEATFPAAQPRAVLLSAQFASSVDTLPPTELFSPIGPIEQRQIMETLRQAARWWREGNGAALTAFMGRYIADYCRAYTLESVEDMQGSLRGMASEYMGAQVEFNPATTLLEPIAGTHLVDCLGPDGAAVRVTRGEALQYDMWAVLGIYKGEAVLVR